MKFCQGILSSNGVTALCLLKFKSFIPSSAITNNWVTLRPTVGRLDFLRLIGQKLRFSRPTGRVTLKTNLAD